MFGGGLHGFYLVFAILINKPKKWMKKTLRIKEGSFIDKIQSIFITFNLACFAWIFFRANTVSDGILVIKKIGFAFKELSPKWFYLKDFSKIIIDQVMQISVLSTLLIFALLLIERKFDALNARFSLRKNYLYFISLILIIIVLGQSNKEQFIYFQF